MHRVTMLFVGLATITGLPGGGHWSGFGGLPAHATELTRSAAVRQVLPASVRIQLFSKGELRRSATGVVVRSTPAKPGERARSIILTNAHVAEPDELKDVTYRVLVERHGHVEQTLPASLVALGHVPELDLALLEVEASLPAVQLAPEDSIDVGSEVVVVGAPYGRALSVSGGLISQLESDDGPGPVRYKSMKTDAAIGYGSSGGGVFDVASGRLVGVVEGYRTARVAIDDRTSFDVPMPGETFIASMSKIRQFISDKLDSVHATAVAAKPENITPGPAAPGAPSQR